MSLFKTIRFCNCAVDLEQVNVDCLATGNMLLSGAVIYTNSEGNVTASTLIDMLQVWLLIHRENAIQIRALRTPVLAAHAGAFAGVRLSKDGYRVST